MKKNAVIFLLIIFVLFTILLPLIIMWLYDLGDICPLIVTPYEESDMLDYSAAVIGVVISVTALLYSIIANAIRFRIAHAVTFNENDEECVLIRIYNDSPYECELQSVSITNKLHNRSAHIIRSKPFAVKAKASEEFPVTVEYAKKVISGFSNEDDLEPLFYELRTGTGKTIYISADKLLQTINTLDAHKKKYGIATDSQSAITARVRRKKT